MIARVRIPLPVGRYNLVSVALTVHQILHFARSFDHFVNLNVYRLVTAVSLRQLKVVC